MKWFSSEWWRSWRGPVFLVAVFFGANLALDGLTGQSLTAWVIEALEATER